MRRSIAIALLLLIPVSAVRADDTPIWPQWRGPTRDGLVSGPAWPIALTPEVLVKVWRAADLPPGYSTPIVSPDRVFVTGTVDKTSEVVIAYDRKTGKEAWRTSWAGAMTVPFFAAKNGSWIRATPAFDGKTLYVAGMRDVLVAIDGATGKEQWRLDFAKEYQTPLPDFGFVCSPLLEGNFLYVQAGGGLVKVDKKTGKPVWRVLVDGGGMNGAAFSSPVAVTLAGKDQLVILTRTKMVGVDKATGDSLWSRPVSAFRGMNILTPQPVGSDCILTSTYGGDTQLFRVSAEGKELTTKDVWKLRYEGYMSSPVVVDGHAYFLGKDKRFICVDVATGKEKWRSEDRYGDYWSLVANKDKILALDQRGTLYLIKANSKEFELLDSRKVADAESWAHLVVCGDEVFVRDLTGLTVFKWKK